MTRTFKTTLSLLILVAVAAVIAACGGGVPSNSVAVVDGNDITKKDFAHWLTVAASSSQPGAKEIVVPDPPTYSKCIAAKKAAIPKPKKGQKAPPPPTNVALKKECKDSYTQLRDQVMQFLITAQWIQKEASEQDVKVTDKDVQKQFDQQKKASFPKQKDFDKFLKQSGMTLADLKMRVKLDLLSNKIREKITKGTTKVTPADIEEYYKKNQKQFEQPERRDLLIILTKTKAQADAAKAALDAGQDFAAVAKQYSTDKTTKNSGGKLPGVTKGAQEKAFDDAVFDAKKGVVLGPVKTQLGYYVFKVTKITPAKKTPLNKATKATIKSQVISQNQQEALNKFVKKFRSHWRDTTECAKGYITPDCKNGKEPKDATAAPGAQQGGGAPPPPAQGGGAPQQAPQQVPAQ